MPPDGRPGCVVVHTRTLSVTDGLLYVGPCKQAFEDFGLHSLLKAAAERVLGLLGFRVVKPGLPHRIGHLVQDFDAYLKHRRMRGRKRKPIYVVGEPAPCNRVIVDYLRPYMHVIEGKWARRLSWLLECRSIVDELEHDYAYTMEGASPCFALQSEWGERAPLFSLTPEHRVEGEACLRELGLPADAWFVCVHSREEGYSTSDDMHHRYRNVDIGNFFPAIKEIVSRGGWCIRMGHESSKALPPMDGLVDYARSAVRSEFMDVFLCARCRFFLGTSSGLFLISSAFGVPSALTNMAPIGCSYAFFHKDLSIPKLYVSDDGRDIPFARLVPTPAADFRWTFLLEGCNVTLRENSPDEILDLVQEMLDRLDGIYAGTPEMEVLQTRFRHLFHENNYSWGSPSRIGGAFLREYRHLLAEPSDDDATFNALPWRHGPIRNPAAGTRRRIAPRLRV